VRLYRIKKGLNYPITIKDKIKLIEFLIKDPAIKSYMIELRKQDPVEFGEELRRLRSKKLHDTVNVMADMLSTGDAIVINQFLKVIK